MIGKTLILLTFFLIIIITYSFLVGTDDPRSYFSVYLPNGSTTPTTYCTQNPLKVYMYDLPKRFNVAMLDPRTPRDDTPLSSRNLPPWPAESGIKRQHSVEYWMMASLLYQGNGDTREAIRVSDPDSAEAFFVPFFSSLSFNTHGHNMTDPDTKYDRQLQVDILEFLRKSKYWQKSSGRDHVIPLHHPNAFRFLRQEANASIFIVADFGRYPESMSNLRKDVVAPYVHVVDSFMDDNDPNPYDSRSTLLFFRGRTVRKDEGIVRAKLERILSGYKDVRYEQSVVTRSNIIESTQGMRSSKFCLHPAGDTPSSCRLFDAIVSHCVPVIVSDKIELPYEDEIDYSRFSIFFSIKESLVPGFMVTQLRQFPKEKWVEMWVLLKEISRHYEFQYPPKKEDAVNLIWRQVKHKLPAVNLAVHRSRRLKIPDWWQ